MSEPFEWVCVNTKRLHGVNEFFPALSILAATMGEVVRRKLSEGFEIVEMPVLTKVETPKIGSNRELRVHATVVLRAK